MALHMGFVRFYVYFKPTFNCVVSKSLTIWLSWANNSANHFSLPMRHHFFHEIPCTDDARLLCTLLCHAVYSRIHEYYDWKMDRKEKLVIEIFKAKAYAICFSVWCAVLLLIKKSIFHGCVSFKITPNGRLSTWDWMCISCEQRSTPINISIPTYVKSNAKHRFVSIVIYGCNGLSSLQLKLI